MIKRGVVAKHLRAIVLGASDRFSVRRRVLAEKFELHETYTFVDAVIPGAATISGFVDTAVIAGVHNEVIGGVAGEGMIVGVDAASNISDAPDAAAPAGLVDLDS